MHNLQQTISLYLQLGQVHNPFVTLIYSKSMNTIFKLYQNQKSKLNLSIIWLIFKVYLFKNQNKLKETNSMLILVLFNKDKWIIKSNKLENRGISSLIR